MPKIQLDGVDYEAQAKTSKFAPARRAPGTVLGIADGPSPVGSTYWKGLFRCPREHALRNLVQLRWTRRREALDVGWLFHAGLETYYSTILKHQQARDEAGAQQDDEYFFGALPDAEAAAFTAVLDPLLHEEGYKDTIKTLERTLGGYFDFYRRNDKWRVIAVEETLQVEEEYLGFPYSARLDLIVEDGLRGGLWLVEHKTAAWISEEILTGYQLDLQILGQVWLYQQCVNAASYRSFRGVVINITTKHTKPKFERVDVCPSTAHLELFVKTMKRWGQLKDECERLDWPQALGNCAGPTRGYTRCDYFDVCHGSPRDSVEQLLTQDPPFGFFRAGDNDPVLVEDEW